MKNKIKPRLGSGDAGFTDLLHGKRVSKTSSRIKLNALIDELGALIGVLRSGSSAKDKRVLLKVQKDLINVAGYIAGAATAAELKTAADEITSLASRMSGRLPKLKKFLIPGETSSDALAHLARSKARLCEILAWRLRANPAAVYLNRLSDFLFLIARGADRK